MADDVWPVSVDNPSGSLRSFNGTGFGLKGFTRVDATGYHFATRWFMIVGFPIIPLERYYLREVSADFVTDYGAYSEITRYDIAGTARLRLGEILRTYACVWLTPVVVILPLIALLLRANDIPLWVSITAVVLWPTTAICLAVMVLMYYRKHWAPLREVQWHQDAGNPSAPMPVVNLDLGGSDVKRDGLGRDIMSGLRGAHGKGENHEEGQQPSVLVEGDQDAVFGTDEMTTPPVIGK
jgi:hypothetical protein